MTGVRTIVLVFFLSPSHLLKCFICMKVLTVERWPGRSADCVDILIFLSHVTDFCLSASRSTDLSVARIRDAYALPTWRKRAQRHISALSGSSQRRGTVNWCQIHDSPESTALTFTIFPDAPDAD